VAREKEKVMGSVWMGGSIMWEICDGKGIGWRQVVGGNEVKEGVEKRLKESDLVLFRLPRINMKY